MTVTEFLHEHFWGLFMLAGLGIWTMGNVAMAVLISKTNDKD